MAHDDEVGQALAALEGAPGLQGVAFSGGPGTGKVTFARALAEVASRGLRLVRGIKMGKSVPLGAFYGGLLRRDALDDPAELPAVVSDVGADESNSKVWWLRTSASTYMRESRAHEK